MNYIYILIEVILVFLLMILFYKVGKKDGLFTYIGFLSSLLSVIMFKSIDILSFEVDLGIPILMVIFVCSNVIIQRYGIDEIKRIIKSFVIPYLLTIVILSFTSLIGVSEYNLTSNIAFDNLFGYNLDNLRLVVVSSGNIILDNLEILKIDKTDIITILNDNKLELKNVLYASYGDGVFHYFYLDDNKVKELECKTIRLL